MKIIFLVARITKANHFFTNFKLNLNDPTMKNLRQLREERKMSQEELARQAGLNKVTLNNVEKGKTNPHAEVRNRIEMVLRQRVNWLDVGNFVRWNPEGDENESWEDVESQLRKAIVTASKLKSWEKDQFIAVGRAYLNCLETYIQLTNEDVHFCLPHDEKSRLNSAQ